jgi:hypothetical protein
MTIGSGEEPIGSGEEPTAPQSDARHEWDRSFKSPTYCPGELRSVAPAGRTGQEQVLEPGE